MYRSVCVCVCARARAQGCPKPINHHTNLATLKKKNFYIILITFILTLLNYFELIVEKWYVANNIEFKNL